MKKQKSKNSSVRKEKRLSEVQEIELLESWIEFGKPDSGSNPLSIKPLPSKAPVGRIGNNEFSPYAGSTKFNQLPLSRKTKDGLTKPKAGLTKPKDGLTKTKDELTKTKDELTKTKDELTETTFTIMTEIQRASLPHSLCGRDILGAAKTGSGKTLAFIIPILEKLYRLRWGSDDGIGCIIITPTRELGGQIFGVLKDVGRFHGFSAGLLIGGRQEVEEEKELVNSLNILVCTPGRLLQHMDETPNFDCSQLQVLVLDEADRILDIGFRKELNHIISQIPKRRQTLLFSATQTKSVQDLARLSLKDPEYISVHEESVTATPSQLQQTAMIVPLDQKLDMLWSFIKAHLSSKILVFLTTCKQVKFVFEAFKKLRPGIPLKCLHGRMKLERRMGIYTQFCESRSVLFSTDVASRGLDFNKAVDWVVQVDCPEDVATYIHRVGRTARYQSGGRSVLFLAPSEEEMINKLQSTKVPLKIIKPNTKKVQPVSGLLAALLVKYPDMQALAQRAFITYLKSIYIQGDKEVFDVTKLPIEEYSASLGLPMTPKIRFLNQKTKAKLVSEEVTPQKENMVIDGVAEILRTKATSVKPKEEEEDVENILLPKETQVSEGNETEKDIAINATRVLKKKKLKINIHRPVGTRVVFDEEGNTLPPLAALSDTKSGNGELQRDVVQNRYEKLKQQMKQHDKEDKILLRQRLKEKRTKEKMKLKRGREEEEESEVSSGSDREETADRPTKKSKKYFDSDGEDNDERKDKADYDASKITLAEQEALALKLLDSMNS